MLNRRRARGIRESLIAGAMLLYVSPASASSAVERSAAEAVAVQSQGGDVDVVPRLRTFERAIAADPENLKLGADYRQLTIDTGQFDRAIDFFRTLAKRPGSGPNVKINLALAYADKVPPAGDIRRLYLGRDAMNALTQSIAERPTVLAYYMRGQINLYYNRLIFHRTDKGVADLTQALSMVTRDTPPALVARVYIALGDGYFRLDDLARARATWSEGRAKFPDDDALRTRLERNGQALIEVVTAALSAGRRSDTSLSGFLPVD
jgi:tetratricopeptide (TPR) repeat protein